MYPKLDYDIEKDFAPLALVASVPQVLVVNPKKVPGDFTAFMTQLRQNPGRLNYGSPAVVPRTIWRRIVQAADQDFHHAHSLPRRRSGAAGPDFRQCGHDV